ncbi:MAG: hypothetical protein YFSK_3760 [Candidatus Yanofskyibacterium parasiticum]|nr:MAG: hypothetical protein YFSK_3760 [Candidatus Yanofskybacteria bacterium]
MNNLQKNFLQALTKTFNAYNEFGARSNKKLIPIHSWISKTINDLLSGEFDVNSLGNGGERTLDGKYYPKNLDITVSKKEKILSTVSFKFVTSNYKQNGNNYFENLLGETANIRRVNVGFAHLLVLRAHTPYYDKNKGNLRGEQTKIEVLNEHDLAKYIKLFIDQDFPHKPDVLGIVVIDVDNSDNCIFADLNKLGLSEETQKILLGELSLEKFIDRFVALCRLKA